VGTRLNAENSQYAMIRKVRPVAASESDDLGSVEGRRSGNIEANSSCRKSIDSRDLSRILSMIHLENEPISEDVTSQVGPLGMRCMSPGSRVVSSDMIARAVEGGVNFHTLACRLAGLRVTDSLSAHRMESVLDSARLESPPDVGRQLGFALA
jgi:hypothetical protein